MTPTTKSPGTLLQFDPSHKAPYLRAQLPSGHPSPGILPASPTRPVRDRNQLSLLASLPSPLPLVLHIHPILDAWSKEHLLLRQQVSSAPGNELS